MTKGLHLLQREAAQLTVAAFCFKKKKTSNYYLSSINLAADAALPWRGHTAQIQIYKEESLTSAHSCYISRDVGNCHNSLRVVLGECQSLTSAPTSARGPL